MTSGSILHLPFYIFYLYLNIFSPLLVYLFHVLISTFISVSKHHRYIYPFHSTNSNLASTTLPVGHMSRAYGPMTAQMFTLMELCVQKGYQCAKGVMDTRHQLVTTEVQQGVILP